MAELLLLVQGLPTSWLFSILFLQQSKNSPSKKFPSQKKHCSLAFSSLETAGHSARRRAVCKCQMLLFVLRRPSCIKIVSFKKNIFPFFASIFSFLRILGSPLFFILSFLYGHFQFAL
jgi:hypothetical protein